MKTIIEPFRIKSVEPIYFTTKEERIRVLEAANYNPFLIHTNKVLIDLLTDSGTSAMSSNQWAGIMQGDESYAGSPSFFRFEDTIQQITGLPLVIPTHQGRAAENVLFSVLVKEGNIVPGNSHFDTTKGHIEFRKATAIDCSINEAFNTTIQHPFKGNIDIKKLQKVFDNNPKNVPFVVFTITCNTSGGQPVSMENIKAVSKLCKAYNIPLIFDAARFAENAYFIQAREKGYEKISIKDIVKEICSYTDGATMSAKKDALVNIGGFLATNELDTYEKARNLVVVYEGMPTYGGLAGRDMEAIAIGIRESVDDHHQHARVGQVLYLGNKMIEYGVPIVKPIGGHGIFVDAKAFLPHIPQDQFPAQTLAAEVYMESGVRTMERGIVSAGRKANGQNYNPKLELVRFTIPRRVYTQAHMDVIAEATANVYEKRNKIKGMKMVYEPEYLRFFQARFEKL